MNSVLFTIHVKSSTIFRCHGVAQRNPLTFIDIKAPFQRIGNEYVFLFLQRNCL